MWHVYIIKCNDNSFYVGLTNNLERRLIEHQTEKAETTSLEVPTVALHIRERIEKTCQKEFFLLLI